MKYFLQNYLCCQKWGNEEYSSSWGSHVICVILTHCVQKLILTPSITIFKTCTRKNNNNKIIITIKKAVRTTFPQEWVLICFSLICNFILVNSNRIYMTLDCTIFSSKFKKSLLDFSARLFQLHLLPIFNLLLFLSILYLIVAHRLCNLCYQHSFCNVFQNALVFFLCQQFSKSPNFLRF